MEEPEPRLLCASAPFSVALPLLHYHPRHPSALYRGSLILNNTLLVAFVRRGDIRPDAVPAPRGHSLELERQQHLSIQGGGGTGRKEPRDAEARSSPVKYEGWSRPNQARPVGSNLETTVWITPAVLVPHLWRISEGTSAVFPASLRSCSRVSY